MNLTAAGLKPAAEIYLVNDDAVVMMVMVASRPYDDPAVSMGRMVVMMVVVGLG